jgi:hypothetical protein
MKKIILALALAASVSAAMAVDVGVSVIRDYASNATGQQVSVTVPKIGGFTPQVAVTNINDMYTRYGVGADYELVKFGPVALSATGAGVFQDTIGGVNGYGLVVGGKAVYDINKNVAVVGTLSRFVGQERVNATDGNSASLGLVAKF